MGNSCLRSASINDAGMWVAGLGGLFANCLLTLVFTVSGDNTI
jgi:hypothetical protein